MAIPARLVETALSARLVGLRLVVVPAALAVSLVVRRVALRATGTKREALGLAQPLVVAQEEPPRR